MAFADSIRVLIQHCDPVVQVGLSIAFRPYPDIAVDTACEWRQGEPLPLRWHGDAAPDVVIADYHGGIALAVEIARSGRSRAFPKVLVMTGVDREREIRSALETGVHGYMLVGCSLDELATGVRAVRRGGRHLSPQIAARLAECVALDTLTAREEDVLELVVQGLCNKAIGRRLGIAVGTVKSHLKSAFDKLDVESRTQAIAAVERRGLLRRTPQSVASADTAERSPRIDRQGEQTLLERRVHSVSESRSFA